MNDQWYDEEAGPLVRPYTITRGRIPSARAQLDMATQVKTIRSGRDADGLDPEHLTIMRLCQRPLSIAELAVYVKIPLGAVRVLCGDLLERGDVIVRSPSPVTHAPDRQLLEAVLDGLNRL
jgi:hypothetical protein